MIDPSTVFFYGKPVTQLSAERRQAACRWAGVTTSASDAELIAAAVQKRAELEARLERWKDPEWARAEVYRLLDAA